MIIPQGPEVILLQGAAHLHLQEAVARSARQGLLQADLAAVAGLQEVAEDHPAVAEEGAKNIFILCIFI
jgi:hypothetical protein